MDSRLQLDSVSGGVEEESNTCSRCVAAAAANRMSCCCCCVAASGELLDGIRKKVRLFSEEEEESRRKMDVSLLREEYRSSREKQKTLTQVLLFRTVSEEPAEAVRIVPVAQGLVSPWEPNTPPPSFDTDQKMYDPWHVHLELHRRSHPAGSTQLPHSRHTWSSSSDIGGSQQESRSRKPSSVSVCSSGETSPCTSLTREKDEAHPDSGTSDGSSGGSSRTCGVDQVQSSSEQHLSEDPAEMSAQSPVISFQGPVDPGPDGGATCTPSTTSPHLNQEQNQSSESITSKARRGSRFSRQLSIGGMCSSSQNHYPFPSRKTPRISEAARRLGMYSSF